MDEIFTTSCASCGSTVRYMPGTTVLHCDTCGNRQDIAAVEQQVGEHSLDEWAGNLTSVAELGAIELSCRSCGAITISDELSTSCQFCGGVLVVVEAPEGVIPPGGVVPFEIDAAAATQAFQTWISGQRFAPDEVRQLTDAGTLRGTYLPMWRLDVEVELAYRGSESAENPTVREGVVRCRFENLEVPASGSIGRLLKDAAQRDGFTVPSHESDQPQPFVPQPLLPQGEEYYESSGFSFLNDFVFAQLGPWDVKQARPFQPEFLVGYSTLRYDIDPQRAVDSALAQLQPIFGAAVLEDLGAVPAVDDHDPTQMRTVDAAQVLNPLMRGMGWKEVGGGRIEDLDVTVADADFTLVLLPVWIGAYTHDGRRVPVHVNAKTGEVEGPRTVSKLVGLTFKGMLLLPGILIFLVLVAIKLIF